MFRRCITLRTDPIKGYKLADMLPQLTNDDVLFARKLRKGGAQFYAWPGVPMVEVAKGMMDMPKELRTSHVVFGRPDLPLDLAFDLDEPVPGNKMKSADMVRAHQKARLLESLEVIHAAIKERGEKVSSQAVLVSPNLRKLSFHIHIKLEDAAFKDYAHLGAFIRSSIYPKLRSVVDPQIYRPNGMLRIFHNMKDDLTSPLSVYDDVALQINMGLIDPTLATAATPPKTHAAPIATPKKTAGNDQLYTRAALTAKAAAKAADPEAPVAVTGGISNLAPYDMMLHSFIQRPSDTFKRFVEVSQSELETSKQLRKFGHTGGGDASESGKRDKRPPMPLNKSEALCNVRDWMDALPPNLSSEFSLWVRVGLYLYRIGQEFPIETITKDIPGYATRDMDKEMLELWVEFSKKCPLKYRIGDCEKRWEQLKPSIDFYSAYCNLAALVPQE